MIEIDKKIFIIAIVMLAVGIMLGRYLFGARGDVSDIEKRIDGIGEQISGAGEHINNAGQNIDRAIGSTNEIERGVIEIQAGTNRGKVLVSECGEIIAKVKERGPVSK